MSSLSLRRADQRPCLQRLAPVLEESGSHDDDDSEDERNSVEENDLDFWQVAKCYIAAIVVKLFYVILIAGLPIAQFSKFFSLFEGPRFYRFC
ncbi:unnamed protein product [Strongylus vulgaris]|uniref:Uncharacterized protein n=1 Tax=Strongylus vulgaris TaxID=40348 RepID=A0A3P7ILU5_STRVU|nr:unnamed protein product [Strongylus vulgaris]